MIERGKFAERRWRLVDPTGRALASIPRLRYHASTAKGTRSTMDDSARKQMVFEANRKSVGVAYLLWLFLGAFGAHRFYAGSTKTGVFQLLLALSVVGWLVLIPWLLADIALIPGMVRDRNMETIEALVDEPDLAARKPLTRAERKREAMLEDLRATGYRKDRRGSMLFR
jgi:hypothetical protein